MNEHTAPVNEESAEKIIEGIEGDAIRNLVRMAVAVARLRFVKGNMSEEEWTATLPAGPFDMAFFASVLAAAFRNEETVRRIILGESISKATGWDV